MNTYNIHDKLLNGSDDLPWVQVAEGVSSKVLSLFPDGKGWVSRLRLEPGARIPLHRHQGEVHGFILTGHRRLGRAGPLIGPSSYEYEPPGNVDTWWVVVHGNVEYLDAEGNVEFVETAETKCEAYHKACAEQGMTPRDLYVS